MLATLSNASRRAILTHPRALLLALVVCAALAAWLVLLRAAEAPSTERPVLVRRPEALPPIVVRVPPVRTVPEDAGR